jgi:hypothetical protein
VYILKIASDPKNYFFVDNNLKICNQVRIIFKIYVEEIRRISVKNRILDTVAR